MSDFICPSCGSAMTGIFIGKDLVHFACTRNQQRAVDPPCYQTVTPYKAAEKFATKKGGGDGG